MTIISNSFFKINIRNRLKSIRTISDKAYKNSNFIVLAMFTHYLLYEVHFSEIPTLHCSYGSLLPAAQAKKYSEYALNFKIQVEKKFIKKQWKRISGNRNGNGNTNTSSETETFQGMKTLRQETKTETETFFMCFCNCDL